MAHIYNSRLDAYTLYHQQHESSSPNIGPALPALGHAIAGSTGAAISNLCIYPLDLIITRLQVQRQLRASSAAASDGEYKGVLDAAKQIYDSEGGLKGFYVGIVEDTGKSIADSFLFFLFYNYLRTNRLQKHGAKTTTLPVLDELTVGAIAGACSKFFTTPVSNIVTRKQTASMLSARSKTPHTEPSIMDVAREIRDENGLLGFWSGYSASLVLTLNPSFTFFLYETFKRTLLPRSRREDPGARVTFLMAAVSKAIASTITYPFSLAKKRAQTSSKPSLSRLEAKVAKEGASDVPGTALDINERQATSASRKTKWRTHQSTVFSTIFRIYREEGPAALYEGVWGEIFKGFFSNGITILVKEAVHKVIIQTYFVILKLLKKMPPPAEAAEQIGDKAQAALGQAGQLANTAGEKASELAAGAGETAQGFMDSAKAKFGEASSTVTATAKHAADGVKDVVGDAAARTGVISNNKSNAVPSVAGSIAGQAEKANDLASKEAGHLLGNAQEMLGQKFTKAKAVPSVAGSIAGQAKKANDLASKEAGHLLGNAQEMLGQKVTKAGKSIRPAGEEK